MAQFLQISMFNLSVLNNSEYQNFLRRFLELVPDEENGSSPVNIPSSDIAEIEKLLAKLMDLNRKTRAMETTDERRDADRSRNLVAAYIKSRVLKSGALLLDEEREAGKTLRGIIAPYKGVGRLPVNQKTEVLKGLLLDLRKEEFAEAVATLGLTPYLDELERLNNLFESLVAKESSVRSALSLEEASRTLRLMADALYAGCIMFANATQVLMPSEKSEAFVRDVNSLIEEVRIAYNLRDKAPRRRRKAADYQA